MLFLPFQILGFMKVCIFPSFFFFPPFLLGKSHLSLIPAFSWQLPLAQEDTKASKKPHWTFPQRKKFSYKGLVHSTFLSLGEEKAPMELCPAVHSALRITEVKKPQEMRANLTCWNHLQVSSSSSPPDASSPKAKDESHTAQPCATASCPAGAGLMMSFWYPREAGGGWTLNNGIQICLTNIFLPYTENKWMQKNTGNELSDQRFSPQSGLVLHHHHLF